MLFNSFTIVSQSRDAGRKANTTESLLERILQQPSAEDSARVAQELLERPVPTSRDTATSPPKTAIRFFNDTLRVEAPPLSRGPPEQPDPRNDQASLASFRALLKLADGQLISFRARRLARESQVAST